MALQGPQYLSSGRIGKGLVEIGQQFERALFRHFFGDQIQNILMDGLTVAGNFVWAHPAAFN
jgi:hypothetical protein